MKHLLLRGLTLLFLFAGSWPARAVELPAPPVQNWLTDGVGVADTVPWPAGSVPQLLGYWTFDSATNLAGFRADPPTVAANLFLVPSPWGSAIRLGGGDPACLRFGVRQVNTNGDFSVRNGTVSFWLRPDWNPGGPTAPGVWTPLVEAGTNSLLKTGWWAWLVGPGGGEVAFLGQARGLQTNWLRAPVGFSSNQWTHLALTWTPTNSSLFVNGALATNGIGVTLWPSQADRERTGWGLGGDRSGTTRIAGDFDLLFTANYPLSAAGIRDQWESGLDRMREVGRPSPGVAMALSAGSAGDSGAPGLPTSLRTGLWLEAAPLSPNGPAGGWIHGTVAGLHYEVFAAGDLRGPWSLAQRLPGVAGQDWTPFQAQEAVTSSLFVVAAPFADTDGDGLSDEYESRVSRTSAANEDTDLDGMPDGWEVEHGLNPRLDDGGADPDGDGYTNDLEFALNQDPGKPDVVPLVNVALNLATIREGSTAAKFTLSRTGPNVAALEVYYELIGPAVNGYDYTRLPERVTFPAGKSTVDLLVTPLADGRDETDESLTLNLVRGAFYGVGATASRKVVIQDNDLPSVKIRATDPEAREPLYNQTDPGELEIRRSGLTEAALVVNLKAGAGNTAVAGTDLAALPKSVTIPAGEISVRFPVTPFNNHKLTGPRLVVAEIAASSTYVIEPDQETATVTIEDVELATVSVTAAVPMAEEQGAKPGRFKFTRTGTSTRPLVVTYHVGGTADPLLAAFTREGSAQGDYVSLPGQVTFPGGVNEVLVDVKPVSDSIVEVLETVEVTIAGSVDYFISSDNNATVTIDDKNPPTFTSTLVRAVSIAGVDGPEGVIEVIRWGSVLQDFSIPFKVVGQRKLSTGQVYPFDDARLRGLGASYVLTVTGGRFGPPANTFVIPRGTFHMEVGLKATLPTKDVDGATLVLKPDTAQAKNHAVFFADRWHLVTFTASSESLTEGGQITLRVTAPNPTPDGFPGTMVRFRMWGTVDELADLMVTGALAQGKDENEVDYFDVAIPAQPKTGVARTTTVTIKALADGKVESPEVLVLQYDPLQGASGLLSSQLGKPYAGVQIRDTAGTVLPPLDCDRDGLPDQFEFDHGLDPLIPDQHIKDEDHDGLLDRYELAHKSDYSRLDTDGDGVNDFLESLLGTDPNRGDPGLLASLGDKVPVRVRTSGALREKVGTCYRCHAPGMDFGDFQMTEDNAAVSHTDASTSLERILLLAPGSKMDVRLIPPPNYKPNVTQWNKYSAEILPLDKETPQGILIEEADPAKPLLGPGLPVAADTFTKKATLRILKKPLLAVDANRDGVIRFDETDRTSQIRPYRFWVNNDDDSAGGDEIDTGVQDHADLFIKNSRDLEDFTRIWIDLQGLLPLFDPASEVRWALEWRNVTTGNPALQLYDAVEPGGGLGYLTDIAIASKQSLPGAMFPATAWALTDDASSGRTVRAGQRFVFPVTRRTYGNRQHLIFEGAAPGRGELVLLVLKKGKVVIESEPLHLELLDVKRLYQRIQATPTEAFPKPYKFHAVMPPPVQPGISTLDLGNLPVSDDFETPHSVIFVHGWNLPINESIGHAETIFKRLWHTGFTGHFCFFRWPTDYLSTPEVLDKDLFDSFNFSENRAWVYGRSLEQCVEKQPSGFSKNVLCHSMGGVVLASSLRLGLELQNAIFMQAAVPAGVFDTRIDLNYPRLTDAESDSTPPYKTPDLFSSERGYRGYLQSVQARVVNFYNTSDFALQTGSYVFGGIEANWINNQIKSRPHFPLLNSSYAYGWRGDLAQNPVDGRARVGHRTPITFISSRIVSDQDEILAFVARSRTRALGAEDRPVMQVATVDNRDLASWRVGNSRPDHSAQFTRTVQEMFNLYQILKFEIERE